MDALGRRGALEATLAAASSDLVNTLLQYCRRQLCKPYYARAAIAIAEHVLNSCSAMLLGEVGLEPLARAVAEEMRTQELCMMLGGMVATMIG